MCAGTLQEGKVIEEAYNFNHLLKMIKTPYSGKCRLIFGPLYVFLCVALKDWEWSGDKARVGAHWWYVLLASYLHG